MLWKFWKVNKFLILLFYYNRPSLVKEAIQSVLNSSYENWELYIIDDGSDYPIDPEYLKDPRITVHTISDTKEGKLARKGSWIGSVANTAILRSTADICVFLCDDDQLRPEYLKELNTYYLENPDVYYSYSHVETFGDSEGDSWLNKTHTLDPFCQVDASQVTWRTSCWKDGGVRFPSPKTSCLDSAIFGQLCEEYGLCPFNGIVGQRKRIHKNQLGNHSSLDKVD